MGVHFSFKNCLFSLNLNQSRMHSSWTKCSLLNPKCIHPYSCLYCLNFVVSEAEVNQIDEATQYRQSLTQKRHTHLWLPEYRCLSQADLVTWCLKQAVTMGHPWQEGWGPTPGFSPFLALDVELRRDTCAASLRDMRHTQRKRHHIFDYTALQGMLSYFQGGLF